MGSVSHASWRALLNILETSNQSDCWRSSEVSTHAVVLSACPAPKEGKEVPIAPQLQRICTRVLYFKFSSHYKMGQVSPYLLTLPPSLRSFLFLFPSICLITYHSLAFFLSHGWNLSQEQDHSPSGTCHVPAAKIRAGVPTKRQNKKVTKDEKICLLEARLAALEHPDDTATISKDPLVS